jgi:hypothetical protein
VREIHQVVQRQHVIGVDVDVAFDVGAVLIAEEGEFTGDQALIGGLLSHPDPDRAMALSQRVGRH